jgi:hypothetical protein
MAASSIYSAVDQATIAMVARGIVAQEDALGQPVVNGEHPMEPFTCRRARSLPHIRNPLTNYDRGSVGCGHDKVDIGA